MTNRLLTRLIPDFDKPSLPQVRSRVGLLSGLVGILCNLILFAGKLTVGLLSGAVSVVADAMNNLSDASGSLVTLAGFRLAERPADENHPYGHARFEYLAGLAVSVMIIIIGFELARSSVQKIIAPEPVDFTWVGLGVLAGSMAVKLWLSRFNRRMGQHIGSAALEAAAQDSRNDVIATAAVLLSALVGMATDWHVDGVMGLAVALFILWSGGQMAWETISPLLGESADPAMQQKIIDLLKSDPMVLGYHDLMVHDYGPGQRFASVHVEMDHTRDVLVCHEHIDNLERECLNRHKVHLVIHYDPVILGDPELDRVRKLVLEILETIDPRLTIHDFRMVKSKGHRNLVFDMALPEDLQSRKQEIREKLDQALAREKETYYTVITFDSLAFNSQSWGI